MKLGTISTMDNSAPRIGVITLDGVLDVSEHHTKAPARMIDLIAEWEVLRPELEYLVATCHARLPLASVRIHAPVPRPGKIAAIGLNYADHIEESKLDRPMHQLWFSKAATSAHGPYEPIQIPLASKQVDYEAELVAVIGKRARHLTAAKAPQAIFGYCAGNDVSVRDWQMQTPQWFLGKSFDTHAPFGPWIVTADEVGDPHSLNIRCTVNGALRQNSNTRNLVFGVYDQLAHLSTAMTLEPGDLIFTGTPGGVGWAMEPKAWLTPGDIVRVEIERIGSIEAKMVSESLN